jgi:transcription-repair coupling factor (superfamily II helicase)
LNLCGLLPLLGEISAYRQLVGNLREKDPPSALGLLAAARPYLVAALQRDLGSPILWVVAQSERAKQVCEQLRSWASFPETILRFPEPDALPYERVPWAVDTIRERLAVLTVLSLRDTEQPPIIVVSARALMQKSLPRSRFTAAFHTLRLGQTISPRDLLAAWYGLGYEPEAVVEEPGTFSQRGGIIDVFPPDQDQPVRIELFGDEIESLRLFDPTTQRSQEKVSFVKVTPASEAFPRYGEKAARLVARLDLSTCHTAAREEFGRDQEALENKQRFKGLEFYIPYLYAEPSMLTDYLPSDSLILIDDWGELEATVADLEEQALNLRRELVEAGELPADFAPPYFTWDELRPALSSHLTLGYDGMGGAISDETSSLGRAFTVSPRYGGRLKHLLEDCQSFRKQGTVVIVTRQAPRLGEILTERGIAANLAGEAGEIEAPPPPRSLTLIQGTLAEGWTLSATPTGAALHLLTDAEIFGWVRPKPRRVRRPSQADPRRGGTRISSGRLCGGR